MTYLSKFSSDTECWFEHKGIKVEREKSRLFVINGQHVWAPRSDKVTIDHNDEMVCFSRWWVEKNDVLKELI